ncbi:MAG: hypothetical protein DRG83_14520 [Deltaproteobacteria bacterium]|nr:MAG: hypothetical protein DRG83_14520 [Deltaproteobacteria bacterium]
MAFDWREFLELAKDLVDRAGTNYSAEAANRTAVSRAYYAAFCWARNYAESRLGFQRRSGVQDHERLRRYLTAQGKPQMASRLNRLRGWRNDCDYDDQVPNISNRVKSALKTANKVIQECI